MEIKDGYPINLNLINCVYSKYDIPTNVVKFEWEDVHGKKFNRRGGNQIWPKMKGRIDYFREDCNILTAKRLIFVNKWSNNWIRKFSMITVKPLKK